MRVDGKDIVRQQFFVGGPLPGMNEIISAAKSGHGKGNAYARLKQLWSENVALAALAVRTKPMAGPVTITCEWKEPHKRRDPDNIHAGIKFILDGLVAIGVLAGDGQRHVARIIHEPATVGQFPGVMVTLQSQSE